MSKKTNKAALYKLQRPKDKPKPREYDPEKEPTRFERILRAHEEWMIGRTNDHPWRGL